MSFQEMDVISKKALSFRLTPALTPNLQKDLVAALDTEVSRFRAAVLADLEEGTDPVEAMHLALARCWEDITPKALSNLGLSPSEFESYQVHHKLKVRRKCFHFFNSMVSLIWSTVWYQSSSRLTNLSPSKQSHLMCLFKSTCEAIKVGAR